LILAVLLISIILIFGASILGISMMAYRSATMQVDNEQAYFTAKSAVDAMVSYLKDPDTSGEQVTALLGSTSTDGVMPEGMGASTVSLYLLDSTADSPVYDGKGNYAYTETIEVTATGSFGDAEDSYTATLTRVVNVTVGAVSDDVPVVFAVLNNDLTLSHNVDGSIYCGKNLTLSGCAVDGALYAGGSVSVSWCNTIDGAICAQGGDATIYLNSGASVNGDVSASGNITVQGGTINGSLMPPAAFRSKAARSTATCTRTAT
jgi:cytoskeletal protein CcmA (bactofilin family)